MANTSFGKRVDRAEAAIAPTARTFVVKAGSDVPTEQNDAFERDVLGVRPNDLVVRIRQFSDRLVAPCQVVSAAQ